jgi:hypothetical protein
MNRQIELPLLRGLVRFRHMRAMFESGDATPVRERTAQVPLNRVTVLDIQIEAFVHRALPRLCLNFFFCLIFAQNPAARYR